MSAALQYFDENLPHRPYHTDDLAFGLRISGKGRALLARYIQQNQPHAQFWLVFDVDREGAAIDWSDRNAPAPNITVKNPVNGHAHRLFLAAGLLIEAGLVDTKTGELCYKKDRILQALKELKYDLETSPNPDA